MLCYVLFPYTMRCEADALRLCPLRKPGFMFP